jgi:hypothetical protein
LSVRQRNVKRAQTHLAVQTEAALARGAPKVPLLPHEHDESAEPSTASPHPHEVQAHADVARGLVDTERRQDATGIFNTRTRRKAQVS